MWFYYSCAGDGDKGRCRNLGPRERRKFQVPGLYPVSAVMNAVTTKEESAILPAGSTSSGDSVEAVAHPREDGSSGGQTASYLPRRHELIQRRLCARNTRHVTHTRTFPTTGESRDERIP